MAPLVACALAVIAGMMVLAGRAWRDADRARQAQVLMERVRSSSIEVSSITWRSFATSREQPPAASIAAGLAAGQSVTASLRDLRALGVSRRRTAEVERRLGEAYGAGLQALVVSRRDPKAARRLALSEFTPAMDRLDAAITTAARRQKDAARAAQGQMRWAGVGSIGAGLLLLALLGWRMHRMQRRSALAEQARAVERVGEERLRALVRHSSDVVAVIDPSSTVRWLAESVRAMLGYEPEGLIGTHLSELVHPEDAHRAMRFLSHAVANEGRPEILALRLRAADGAYRHLELIADNRLADPVIDGILLNLRDVSERLELEEQLRHQAFHDGLTGLANRALFEDRLTQALVRARRQDGQLAVMFLDLDDFKTVNDSLDHAVGDKLLNATARRVEETLRAQDTAARLGGDEFAILLEDVTSDSAALAIADRVLDALAPPVSIDGRQLTIAASIGVACPAHSATAEEVLRNAEVAMYAAKQRGKGRVAGFEAAMHEQVVQRLELTGELGTALENDELVLVYQPVVELLGSSLIGFEALLRWEHPERGRLAPDRFIELAESTGLIVPIGHWVLRTACTQLVEWEANHPSAQALEMSVNVSMRQIADPEFPGHVRDALAESGIDPAQLTLEITERLLVDDSHVVLRQLEELKDLGVRLAVDDFGTGYSALSYLQSFPIDVLKIDRSFVSGMDHDTEKGCLLRGIIDMGHGLGLQIVTEGIEQPGQAALLRDFGSDFGQGYLFSRPLDAGAVTEYLADRDHVPVAVAVAEPAAGA